MPELNLAAWIPELSRARNQKSSGIKILRKHYQGARITMGQAVKAKCCECMVYYEDGANDCENPRCPLYHWMPYRKKEGCHE